MRNELSCTDGSVVGVLGVPVVYGHTICELLSKTRVKLPLDIATHRWVALQRTPMLQRIASNLIATHPYLLLPKSPRSHLARYLAAPFLSKP